MSKLNLAELIGKMSKIQQQMASVQQALAQVQVHAEVGGGMVKVTATGTQEIVDIQIEPDIINPDDPELLRDLIIAGVNKALKESSVKAKEEMQSAAGDMLPPGLGLSNLSM